MRRSPFILSLVLASTAGLGGAGEARACSLGKQPGHTLEPARFAGDRQAPVLTGVRVIRLRRGYETSSGAPAGYESICPMHGYLTIEVSATDDQTPTAELGFRLQVKSGKTPQYWEIPAGDLQAFDGKISLNWVDDASDDQEAFDFVLAVAPVDRAGNVGAALDLSVSDPGRDGGCAVGGGGHPRAVAPLMLLVVLGAVRRARRC
jgi:MYXO-CTERM domain-containing protein